MSNIMDKKFLLAVVLLVCLVAIYAEAQRYGGGGMYGGGRGGYGGGRGYYGGGMYGGGRGGYGGGRGYYGGGGGGGYGGGRGGYRGYHHDQNSVYPSGYSSLGGGGGYYDDMSGDDDYSSYGIDVYAASSSNPNQLTTTNVQSDGSQAASSFTPTVAAGASSTPRANRQPLDWGQRQQQPDGISPVQDLLNFNGDSNRQWPGQSNDWNRQGQFGSGADYTFDLTTGGANDQSTSGSSDRASERHVLLNGSLARASAANSPTAHGNDSRQLSAAHSSRPSVPTSTTTPAPEFIMINPTTTSS